MFRIPALATLVLAAFACSIAFAQEKAHINGVLIDQMCGEKCMKKDDPQKAAENHPKSCIAKCADSGYAVMSDGKLMKLDAASNDKVKDYLASAKSTTVVIDGSKNSDGAIMVDSITASDQPTTKPSR